MWRSARQQLGTLSTAESELLEGVEGVVLANATKALLEELRGGCIKTFLHLDNQSALQLLQGSTGSRRTRHLRLRASFIRERIQQGDLCILFEPGLTQRADLETKPFTRERLQQLIQLWNMCDRRRDDTTAVRFTRSSTSWFTRLIMFCQVCCSTAQKEQIQTEMPWDLYLIVLVLAIAVIGLWEGGKNCWRGKEIRLQALRTRASYGRLTRSELKELQRLLALEPSSLTDEQGTRLLYLKDLFEQTMPSNTSPVPTLPKEDRMTSTAAASSHEVPQHFSSSTTSSTSMPVKPVMKDQSTQKDFEPAFQRMMPQPPVRVETFAGPYHHVPGTETLHVHPKCWGLRNTGRAQPLRLCRCCVENGGKSLYDR